MHSNKGLVLSALLGGMLLPAVAEAQGTMSFRRHVLPILNNSCVRCHKEPYKDKRGRLRKPKGNFRVDGKGWLLAGGKNGSAVVAGKPGKSTLYQRVSLPHDDDDYMPSKGDPLTAKQIQTIHDWIAQGAKFGSWSGKVGPAAAVVKKAQAAASVTKLSTSTLQVYAELGKGLKPAPAPAIKRAAGTKCQVVPVTPNSPLLRVAFVSNEASVHDEDLEHLEQLATHITHLGLAKTRITDAGMEPVSRMRRLTRLDLNQTHITDLALVRLATLTELRHLNLHSTDVSDAGLQALAQLPKLERLYLWNTKVSRDGIKKIRRLLPRTKISYELDLPKPEPATGGNRRRRR